MNIKITDHEAKVLEHVLHIYLKANGIDAIQNAQFFLGKIEEAKMEDAEEELEARKAKKETKKQQ